MFPGVPWRRTSNLFRMGGDALPDVTRARPARGTDNLSAFRAAVAALRPEQFKEAERILREAGQTRKK